MATNMIYPPVYTIPVGNPTTPADVKSGDPVALGDIVGIALTDDDTAGHVTGGVTIARGGVWALEVKGETTTDAAVSAGDRLYLDGGVVNKDSSNGVPFGYAWGTYSNGKATPASAGDTLVASGATTTIAVLVDA